MMNTQVFDSSNMRSDELMKLEDERAAHNYHPIPIVFSHASGSKAYDKEGKAYYDFLSAYSAVSQGHCHPRIVNALVQQAKTCTLTSRAFYNDIFPLFAKKITDLLGYDMVLPMNTGAEAVETALKVSRKWAYTEKHVKENEAIIICCKGCFHGRTLGTISLSDDPESFGGYGPFLPGIKSIPYDDIDALREVLESEGDRVACFIVEPIQGEAGVVLPSPGYLKACYDLCKAHRVLFVADEVQTGLCRTGYMLAVEYDQVRPDVVILGKALGGGILPVSAVMADRHIMLSIKPGQHGSTFGGNPLSSAVAIEALNVLVDLDLAGQASKLGCYLGNSLAQFQQRYPLVELVRGRGLLYGLVLKPDSVKSAWKLCTLLKNLGLATKPTHDHIIRLAPPLVITLEELNECISIIDKALALFHTMSDDEIKALP